MKRILKKFVTIGMIALFISFVFSSSMKAEAASSYYLVGMRGSNFSVALKNGYILVKGKASKGKDLTDAVLTGSKTWIEDEYRYNYPKINAKLKVASNCKVVVEKMDFFKEYSYRDYRKKHKMIKKNTYNQIIVKKGKVIEMSLSEFEPQI